MVEKWSGTRGSFYIYVGEGKVLRHISHYAVKKEKINNLVFYEVPISKISGKKIFLVDFTCSGYGFIREYIVEDRIDLSYYLKMDKCKVLKGLGVLEEEGIEMLKDYEFEINDNELKQLINEFETTYLQMINEIKEYKERLKFEIFFARHAERTRNVFKNLKICYPSCLFLPDDRKRKMSLRNVCKWIYQLWILKLFCEVVETIEIVKKEWASKPYW